jgi:hypothetical protein
MTTIPQNSGICNVCQQTNWKDDVKMSEVAVHESLNTKKYIIKVSTTHTIKPINAQTVFTYNLS